MSEQPKKFDSDKPQLDLIPGVALRLQSRFYNEVVPVELDQWWERGHDRFFGIAALSATFSAVDRIYLGVDNVESLARVMEGGAKKYGRYNWLSGGGFEWSRLYGAFRRHLVLGQQYWPSNVGAVQIDPDFGQPHLSHAKAMLMFLLFSVTEGFGTDDRPPCASTTV